MAATQQGKPTTQRRAMILDFDVYLHGFTLTTAPDAGVTRISVPMIIGYRGSGWHIDCLDLEAVLTFAPKNTPLDTVMLKAAGVMAQAGVNPRDVRGWGAHFKENVVKRVWADLGLT